WLPCPVRRPDTLGRECKWGRGMRDWGRTQSARIRWEAGRAAGLRSRQPDSSGRARVAPGLRAAKEIAFAYRLDGVCSDLAPAIRLARSRLPWQRPGQFRSPRPDWLAPTSIPLPPLAWLWSGCPAPLLGAPNSPSRSLHFLCCQRELRNL